MEWKEPGNLVESEPTKWASKRQRPFVVSNYSSQTEEPRLTSMLFADSIGHFLKSAFCQSFSGDNAVRSKDLLFVKFWFRLLPVCL